MKKILILLSLLSSLAASAQEGSYFEQLAKMYSKGTKPDPEKLVNTFWAGRCFFANNPNVAKNGAYIVMKIGDTYRAAALSSAGNPAYYYDNTTFDEAIRLSASFIRNARLSGEALTTELYNGQTNRLRVSGKYLVLEGRNAEPEGPIGPPSEVFAYCYYFIPEQK